MCSDQVSRNAVRIAGILACLVLPVQAALSSQAAEQKADLNAGVSALKAGQLGLAESSFRAALAGAPGNAGLWRDLGMCLFLQNRFRESVQALNRSYRLDPEAGTFTLLITAYCSLGDEAAIKPRLHFAKRYWSDPKALSQLLDCYARYGDPIDSVLAYRAAVYRRLKPLDRNLVGLARAYMTVAKSSLGQLKSAPGGRPYSASMESAQGGNADAATGALPYLRRERPDLNPESPFEDLVAKLQVHPHDPALLYLTGLRSGQLALATFTEASGRFPQSTELAFLKADIAASQGRADQAEALLSSALGTAPDDLALRYKFALFYYGRQDWEKAYTHFVEVLRNDPRHEPARARASECLLRLGRLREEIQLLQESAHAEHTPAWLLLDLATAEQGIGERKSAIRHLEQAIASDKTLVEAHYRLAQLYSLTGHTEDSRREWQEFKTLKGRAWNRNMQ